MSVDSVGDIDFGKSGFDILRRKIDKQFGIDERKNDLFSKTAKSKSPNQLVGEPTLQQIMDNKKKAFTKSNFSSAATSK